MYTGFKEHLQKELQDIKDAGLYKNERVIVTPQKADIAVEGTQGEVLNFCANNYLGLSEVLRTCTRNWRRLSPTTSRPRTLSSTPLASMPTAVCSSLCSPRRTLLSPTL